MEDNKMQEELYDEDEVNIGEILLVLWRHNGSYSAYQYLRSYTNKQAISGTGSKENQNGYQI